MGKALSAYSENQIVWALLHYHGWEYCPQNRVLYNPQTGEYLIIPEDRATTHLLLSTNLN